MLARMLQVLFLIALASATAVWLVLGTGQALPDGKEASASAILLQQATDYPYPYDLLSTESGYPGGFETAETPASDMFSTETPEPTSAVNIFATENAQMQDSLSTQAPSATPEPTITPANTATAVLTPTLTVVVEASTGQNRFKIEWSYFWVGFAIPLLICCGVVLYLLDRYPNIFTPHPKP